MAPRLSRWIALTVVASGLVATTLLSTGGTPLLYLMWGRIGQGEGEMSQADRRIDAVKQALAEVRGQLVRLGQEEQFKATLARTAADPLVLRWDAGRLVIDRAATAALDSLWGRLASRRSDLRTVVLQEGGRRSPQDFWSGLRVDFEPDGVCLVRPFATRSPAELQRDLRTTGGECLFSEEFGAPGQGVREWRTGFWSGLSWDRTQRWEFWRRRDSESDGTVFSVWFQEGGPDIMSQDYQWGEVNRLEMACRLGRTEYCIAAAGVGEAGWPDPGRHRRWNDQYLPPASLPRDLRRALGPTMFGEIWTSDRPIAVSYAAATGEPMDGWIMRWARKYWGVIQRDNGLSLVGWLGAFIWIGLIALLIGQRLKQRAAT